MSYTMGSRGRVTGRELCTILLGSLIVLLLLPAGIAHAGFTMDMVTVGNAGNAGDTATGYGSVAYAYQTGKYEVTAAQYTGFLNAVAATDIYGLCNSVMWTATEGCKIQQGGSSGSYTYTVASDYANRPVNGISWGDAARFANWMANGQPTGAENLSTTEDGSYYLNGANTDTALMAVTRKANATWVIPSENEWYKAAYYEPAKAGGAGYWAYPTQSDSIPGRDMTEAATPGNNANHWGPGPYPIDNGAYTTKVGEFEKSASPYGTFDQAGNVFEWNETAVTGTTRGVRGGGWGSSDNMGAIDRNNDLPLTSRLDFGFRMANVPAGAPLSRWKVDTPIVTFWGGHPLTDQIAQRDVAGGYNVDWAGSWEELDVAAQHGLRARLRSDYYLGSLLCPESLDGRTRQAQLDALIDRYKTHPAAYAYFFTDEPSTVAKIDYWAPLIAYVRARDPDHLCYVSMGAPDWVGDAVWRYYIDTVHPQMLSYAYYNLMKTAGGANYDEPKYLSNLGKVAGWAKAENISFMPIVQACVWESDPTPWRLPNENELRFLVYSTLAYGAQGISFFNYYTTPTPNYGGIEFNPDGTPTAVYTALATLNPQFVKVAKQYQPLKWIGAYLKGYSPTSMPPGTATLPSDSPFTVGGVSGNISYSDGDPLKGVLLGLFDKDGATVADATFVLVQNLDYTSSHIYTVTGLDNLSIFDAITGLWTATGHNYVELNLSPGGGILVGLTSAVPEPGSLVLLVTGVTGLLAYAWRKRK